MKFTKEHQNEAQGLMNTIISKCWEDEAFKAEFIASPVATIEKITGQPVNLPEGVKVVVNDQTDLAYTHLNIPAKPNFEDFELSDEQLEAVAGGVFWIPVTIGLCLLAYNGYMDAKEN